MFHVTQRKGVIMTEQVLEQVVATTEEKTETSYMDDLLAAIDEEETAEFGTLTDPKYAIQTRDDAEYRTKQYNKLMSEINDIENTAKNAIDRHTEKVNRWKDSQLKSKLATVGYIKGLLEDYATTQLKDSKKKSIKLIEGTLAFRNPPPVFTRDDDAIRSYMMFANPDYLEDVPAKVKWAEIKKAGKIVNGKFLVDDNEVPGVEVEELNPVFSVK